MNTDKINHYLATVVMKWDQRGAEYYNQNDYYRFDVDDWNPVNNLNQAFMCAAKMDLACVQKTPDMENVWFGVARLSKDFMGNSLHDNPATALSLAIYKATGGEDE